MNTVLQMSETGLKTGDKGGMNLFVSIVGLPLMPLPRL